jgi:hypothetical protein
VFEHTFDQRFLTHISINPKKENNMVTTTPKATERQNSPQQPAGAAAELQPTDDAIQYLKTYARQRPEVAALWCLGIGFVLGWKLKPW